MRALLGVLLLAMPAAAQSIRTELVTSETLSLFYFAEAVAGVPSRSAALREVYEQHRAEAPDAPAQLERAFRVGPKELNFYANAAERPSHRWLSRDLEDVLEVLAVRSATLEEFGKAALGVLPVEAWVELMAALRQLAPIHQRHVWAPRKASLEKSRLALAKEWKRANTDALLGHAARFYGARWPEGLPVTIALVPVPGGGTAFAHSRGPLEVVEVLDGDDLSRRHAVLVHELAHSLYEEQPLETKLALERLFLAPGTPLARATYATINEALATAIGNGLAAERAGKPLAGSWYDDPAVDGLARELFPLVKRYLDEDRAIDGPFVEAAIAGMGKRFPDAERWPRFLFSNLHLITAPGIDSREVERQLGTVVRFRSLQRSSPHTHPKTLEQYARMKDATLIVVPRASVGTLSAYPFFAAMKPLVEGGGDAYVALRDGERLTTVVLVEGEWAPAVKRLIALTTLEMDRAVPLK